MYGIFTYIWLIFMGNVGKYTIHGFSGLVSQPGSDGRNFCSEPREMISFSRSVFVQRWRFLESSVEQLATLTRRQLRFAPNVPMANHIGWGMAAPW